VSRRREPSAPPLIPGFDPVRLLGMGGFADVFVYRQQMPEREVAVKVLTPQALNDDVRERFRMEANLMAQLSQHPAIVTIHHADVASDGRPFFVMELCSRPGLGARYRTESISVAETLRLGVRLASAVESAHRMGILHYDIKPANVLTTDFGWPALTDFGIASTIGHVASSSVGMSIPWSPPELMSQTVAGDPRSDVYSLIATLYSALAGRSPFEISGEENTAAQLMSRIERAPVTPTGRGDVPVNLELILERGLAKNPRERYTNALEVAQALQVVEGELGLPATNIEVVGGDGAHILPAEVSQADQETRRRPLLHVDSPSHQVEPEAESENSRSAALIATLLTVAVLLIGTVVWAGISATGESQGEITPTSTSGGHRVAVPTPRDVEVERISGDRIEVTWLNPDPQTSDTYLWAVVEEGRSADYEMVDEESVVFDAPHDGQICVEVSIVRSDRRQSDEPAVQCS